MPYAGVLPFAVDENGSIWVLLGQEHASGNERASLRWSDFGGHIDRGETPLQAAAREAFEESMGLLGSAHDIERQLIAQRAPQVRTRDKRGVHFLLCIALDHTIVRAFNAFRYYANMSSLAGNAPLPAMNKGFWEKVRAGWFPLHALESSVSLRYEFLLDFVALRAALQRAAQRARRQ